MKGRAIGVGMIGLGTVGAGVAKLLQEQAAAYAARVGAPIQLRKVLVRDVGRQRSTSVSADLLTSDADAFFNTPDMPIVIEVAGGGGVISDHVRRAILMGKHVITANKSLLASEGAELFTLACDHGVCIAFEASCGGGIPIITATSFGLMANRIDAVYGILNGTCNYILTEMTQKAKTYAVALAEAQAAGFAEADPALDVSGRDAGQKLAVLAGLVFGVRVHQDQVSCEGIDQLQLADIRFGQELGYDIKLLAIGERVPARGADAVSLRVHPCFIHQNLPLAQVHGSFNGLSIFGHAVGHTFYSGRGAGQMPTASAVVSDLLNVASGWYPHAFSHMNLWCNGHPPAQVVPADELLTRFYVRVNALDVPGVMAKITRIFGDLGISISSVLQHEVAVGQFVPVVVTTHQTRQGAITQALAQIEQLDVVQGPPVRVRILDMPEG